MIAEEGKDSMTVGRGKGCRDSEKRERTQEQHGEGKDAETVRKGKGHRNNWERERIQRQ